MTSPSIDAKSITLGAKSLAEALTNLANTIRPDGTDLIFYGFHVHMQSAYENDFIVEHSHSKLIENQNFMEAFVSAGATRDDVVAPRLPNLSDPFPIDIPSGFEELRDKDDAKAATFSFFYNQGFHTAWVAPISEAWSGGFGVLNHFLCERFAPAPIEKGALIPLAHDFHDAARKSGLVAGKLGITKVERRTLSLVAQGKTAKAIALVENVGEPAIERRIERVRKKLKASNSAEAIYKGMVYGALPFR